MDKINKINSVVSVLRAQLSKNLEKKDRGNTNNSSDAKHLERPTINVLEKRVVERLGKLDEKNDEYPKQAAQVIIESILTWEFGDTVLHDPEFETLVANVINNMKSSGKLSAMLDEFIGAADHNDR